MSYDKPPMSREAKELVLAHLNRAIKQILEPPSYGDFFSRDFHDDSSAIDTHPTNPKTWGNDNITQLGERIAKGRR